MKKLLCLLIFATFFGSSFTLFKIAGISVNVFRAVFIIFLTLHVMHLLTAKNKPTKNSAKHPYFIAFGVFCFFTLLTAFWCPSLKTWADGCIFLIINFCIINFVNYYTDTEKDLRVYLGVYVCGIIMTVIISIYEFKTGVHVVSENYLNGFVSGSESYRFLAKAPTAFLYNPNNVAVSIVLGITLGGYIFKADNKSLFIKAFKVIYMLACLYAIFATGSRGGILICIMAIVLNYLLTKMYLSRKAMTLFMLIFTTAVVVNFAFPLIFHQLRYAGFFDSNKFEIFNSGDSSRFKLLDQGFQVAMDYFFMGGGPNSAEKLIALKFGTAASVHMFWLETLINYGIIGLGCLVWFYLKCLSTMLKLRKSSVIAKDIAVLLLLFLPVSVIPPTIYTLYNIWLIFGFSIACEKLYSRENLKAKGDCYESKYIKNCIAY